MSPVLLAVGLPPPLFIVCWLIGPNIVTELIEQGLTSHQNRGRFYRSYDQTNSVKALKEASWSFA